MVKNYCSLLNTLLLFSALSTRAMKQEDDNNPLLKALTENQYALAEELIMAGVSVNVCDSHGNTPLHRVAFNLDKPLILERLAKLLIEKGANIDAKSKAGNYPLTTAAFWSNFGLCDIFIENGADVDLIMSEKGTPGYNCTIKQFLMHWTIPCLQEFCTEKLLERQKKRELAPIEH